MFVESGTDKGEALQTVSTSSKYQTVVELPCLSGPSSLLVQDFASQVPSIAPPKEFATNHWAPQHCTQDASPLVAGMGMLPESVPRTSVLGPSVAPLQLMPQLLPWQLSPPSTLMHLGAQGLMLPAVPAWLVLMVLPSSGALIPDSFWAMDELICLLAPLGVAPSMSLRSQDSSASKLGHPPPVLLSLPVDQYGCRG